jgi:glycosyltransferase involved in cell wall biosynthesis
LYVDLPGPVPHADPWVLSGETRLSRLQDGAPRIAYLYARTDNSTFRYRVHNMIETIEALWPDAAAAYFTLADAALLDRVADLADVVVVCRVEYNALVSRFLNRVRRRAGVPLLFDVDDLVFDTRYVHLIMDALDRPMGEEAEWMSWFGYIGRIGETLRHCERGITTNSFLAARIADFASIEARVVPNYMNAAQLGYSRQIRGAKRESGFRRDGALHIGYFSGSPTHAKDFALAESALANVLRRHPAVRVRMVGYLEPAGALLAHGDRIDREPFHDYVNLQRLIGSTEINIAPLQDNAFTNCKSELKYFEAAVTGTATIASPTHTFAAAIRPGENGRLAAAHEWEERILETIEEIESRPRDHEAMAERAAQDAEQRFGWRNQIEAIRAALF